MFNLIISQLYNPPFNMYIRHQSMTTICPNFVANLQFSIEISSIAHDFYFYLLFIPKVTKKVANSFISFLTTTTRFLLYWWMNQTWLLLNSYVCVIMERFSHEIFPFLLFSLWYIVSVTHHCNRNNKTTPTHNTPLTRFGWNSHLML